MCVYQMSPMRLATRRARTPHGRPRLNDLRACADTGPFARPTYAPCCRMSPPSTPFEACFGLDSSRDIKWGFPNPPTAPAASNLGFSIASSRSSVMGGGGSMTLSAFFLGRCGLGRSNSRASSLDVPDTESNGHGERASRPDLQAASSLV